MFLYTFCVCIFSEFLMLSRYHVNRKKFGIPFVSGAKDLGEAVRGIAECAAMIRSKGNAGTGNVMEAVRHGRLTFGALED